MTSVKIISDLIKGGDFTYLSKEQKSGNFG